MQKTQAPQPKTKALPFKAPDHSGDDFLWEFFKVLLIAGTPTLLLFYTFEIFIPFHQAADRFEKKCIEKGGFVYNLEPQKTSCLKKDIVIKIE